MYQQRLIALSKSVFNSFNNNVLKVSSIQKLQAVPTRNVGYYDSKLEESPEKYTEVEKSFAEWKFVEDLLPPTYVPEAPTDPSVEYPSGWKPQSRSSLAYQIPRTKNYMIPVYFHSHDRGMVQYTRIRNVEGNIWVLEKQIGRFLKDKYPEKTIMTHVNEQCRFVHVRGDYLEEVKQWLLDRGF